ncbi:MAG TPA: RNA-binding protein [Rhizomicrobium sp.]|nr:RNA-binding protein [Rhizomicrobium sp.]
MTAAARKMDKHETLRHSHVAGASRSRERRCIVTGKIMPDDRLVRFVMAPDGLVVPDVAAKLPGRGLWVTATRAAVAEAAENKLFSRAAKAPARVLADLPERTEKALVARILGDLGLARRASALILGFDNVLRALEGQKPPQLLIEAADGAGDGKRKLYNAAHARGMKPKLIECLTSAELGLALGRENVIHAAVQPGGLAERLFIDAERLQGFRARFGSERDL